MTILRQDSVYIGACTKYRRTTCKCICVSYLKTRFRWRKMMTISSSTGAYTVVKAAHSASLQMTAPSKTLLAQTVSHKMHRKAITIPRKIINKVAALALSSHRSLEVLLKKRQHTSDVYLKMRQKTTTSTSFEHNFTL